MSTVNTCSLASSRCRASARREFRQGFVEAALAEAQHAASVLEHDLGPRVGRRAQRLLRASEMALGFGEARHPHERHAGHRECAGRHRLAGPAMLLCNRERPLAELERERQRLPGERRRECEVREAADLDERPREPTRAAEGVLEMLPCLVGAAGPQFRESQVHEGERPVVGRHRQLAASPASRRALLPVGALLPELWADRCGGGRSRPRQWPGTRRRCVVSLPELPRASRRATSSWAAASSSRPWRMLSIASAAARFPSSRWAPAGNAPSSAWSVSPRPAIVSGEEVVHE